MSVLIQVSNSSTSVLIYVGSTLNYFIGATGLTLVSQISFGGVFAAGSGTILEVGNGYYAYVPTAGETAVAGAFVVRLSAMSGEWGAAVGQVVGFNPADAVRLGLTSLPTQAPATSDGLLTVGIGAGQISPSGGSVSATFAGTPDVNVISWLGTAVTLDTGLPAVSGVVAGVVDANVVSLAAGVITAASLGVDVPTFLFESTLLGEAYPADGAEGSVAELLYLLVGLVGQFSISGTTLTVRQLDGTTPAALYTLNSSTSPTSRIRTL